MKSLVEVLPAVYTEVDADGTQAALVTAYDGVHEVLLEDIAQLGHVAIAQKTLDVFLPNVADRYGNPFKFLSTGRMKGRVENLASIYRRRGTKVGIIATCYYLCGIIPQIVEDFEWGWTLGVSKLEMDTRLVASKSSSFWVKIPNSVPDNVRKEMETIINFMKPARVQWRYVLTEGVLPLGAVESAVVDGDNLVVSGWAADVLEGAPVAWVDIQVDDISITHADLDPDAIRGDIQAFMEGQGTDKDCTKSQWSVKLNLADLELGQHIIKAVAHKHDGHMAVIGQINV